MWQSDAVFPFLFLTLVQFLGIATVFIIRCVSRNGTQNWHQPIFFLVMIAVGCASLLALGYDRSCGISCGAVLSLMAVGGTIDLSPLDPAADF